MSSEDDMMDSVSSAEDLDDDNMFESDDMDDDDDAMFDSEGDDDFSDGGGAAADDDVKTEVLTPADLISTQIQAVEEINNIFEIPVATARLLLQHFQWDKERLVDRYYGGGDIDKIFEEAHCVNPTKSGSAQADAATAADAQGGPAECGICMCDYEPKEMTRVDCGCIFCNSCWREYLATAITEKGQADIVCPADDCEMRVDELSVTRLLEGHPESEEVLRKYQAALARQYVSDNKMVKFCPSPGCDNAIRVSTFTPSKPFYVTCKCSESAKTDSHQFCFNCSNPAHDPVRCEMLRIWLKKCEDDSETSNWIAANTKECPKCRATIEKHGGCNHMICQQSHCKYEFCWVCLGPWAPHGSSWYNCNRFEQEDAVAARDAESKSRAALERYLFYFNRYANHQQSLQFEAKLRKLVDEKIALIQRTTGMSWIEVQFLTKAVDALRECRMVLMYTYVFAYYLQKNNECEIFEKNQTDLQVATETLSGYLENDLKNETITTENIITLKQKVLDKSTYCLQRRTVLLGHVKEGVSNGKWAYQPESVEKIMQALPVF